jgi:hypothetical protein
MSEQQQQKSHKHSDLCLLLGFLLPHNLSERPQHS